MRFGLGLFLSPFISLVLNLLNMMILFSVLSKMKFHFLVSVFSCEFMPQHSLLPLSGEP
jgi:hypothetical protein